MSDLEKKVQEILADLQYEGCVELPDRVTKVLRSHLKELAVKSDQRCQILRNTIDYLEADIKSLRKFADLDE